MKTKSSLNKMNKTINLGEYLKGYNQGKVDAELDLKGLEAKRQYWEDKFKKAEQEISILKANHKIAEDFMKQYEEEIKNAKSQTIADVLKIVDERMKILEIADYKIVGESYHPAYQELMQIKSQIQNLNSQHQTTDGSSQKGVPDKSPNQVDFEKGTSAQQFNNNQAFNNKRLMSMSWLNPYGSNSSHQVCDGGNNLPDEDTHNKPSKRQVK